MSPLFRLPQIEAGSAYNDGLAVVEEVLEQAFEVQHDRLVIDNREHDDPERALHCCQLVELVEDDLRHLAPLHIHHDPNPVAIRFVPQIADPLDLLVSHQFGYSL